MASWSTVVPSSGLAVNSGLPVSWIDAVAADIQTIGQAPPAYSPSFSNLTVGNGTLAGYANKVGITGSGGMCDLFIAMTSGSTTAYNSTAVTISLPYTSNSSLGQTIWGELTVAGTGKNYLAKLRISAGAAVGAIYVPSSATATDFVPMTISQLNPGTTTGGGLSFTGRYWTA